MGGREALRALVWRSRCSYWTLQRFLPAWLVSAWIIADTCLLVYQIDKAHGSQYNLLFARYAYVLPATVRFVLWQRNHDTPALVLHQWLADYVIRGWALSSLNICTVMDPRGMRNVAIPDTLQRYATHR
ncbi:hypothetical protein BDY17DRAFT_52654 [Neohortaea acidophila]|uniref:Uncharacterized protein n=1 Tax=Neohortaea acidophila TaxID=245834 RepID=A0A6A6PHH8_9PEZI|nr:uncharacterized protein BDY17DRAFT_52654 [Neohortaea acidophila]KAF2479236.1 hypothetical protein BDY17DRAFT_52654 [Neohortaea acidophila]